MNHLKLLLVILKNTSIKTRKSTIIKHYTNMNIKQQLLFLAAILFLIGCKQEPVTKNVNPVKNISLDSIVKLYKNPSDQYVMVIAHRAAWRNFPENSIEAIRSA